MHFVLVCFLLFKKAQNEQGIIFVSCSTRLLMRGFVSKVQILFHHERKQSLQSGLLQSTACTSQSFKPECGQFNEHLTREIFRILPAFSQVLSNLTFIFSGSHEK